MVIMSLLTLCAVIMHIRLYHLPLSQLSLLFFHYWVCILIFSFIFDPVYLKKSFVPRGAPIRFNRQRQKIYVYEYQRN